MTSVEWLVDKVEQISNNKNLSKQEAIDLYNKSIIQAKEMHKQEIIDAYHINPLETKWGNKGIEYYNETFKKN